ncbi:reverse transcriptase domain-containing protein [Serratia marcescens]|uniref:reverse transcriptase domain-containing protein n=1 Tax=Serratia marcescens TaxID=615 RepID=UPI000F0C2518|nr:reverse transcriptase domain-containing protein [Serratia marcescens]BBG67763.1 hypothetical protein SERAS_05660 [Serratia marcescens]
MRYRQSKINKKTPSPFTNNPEHHSQNNRQAPPFTTQHIDTAYQWLIKQRQHYPDSADIWHLRFHWKHEREALLLAVNSGRYRFSPLQVIKKADGETLALWASRDALVLKMLTAVLAPVLPVHRLREHVRGHGGGRQSTLRVHHHLQGSNTPFVFRTDIKGYYAAIDKQRLYTQLVGHVTHPVLLDLLAQLLHYSVEDGGNFHTPTRGISRGAALSPLLAAFHLYAVDCDFAAQPRVRYVRYMDDFLILAPTRWSLRRAVARLKQHLHAWGFTLHPDKTQLGRTEQGFDWMGLWFDRNGVRSFAPRAIEKHRLQCRRLYERIRNLNKDVQAARMAMYRRRWVRALVPLTVGLVCQGAVDLTPHRCFESEFPPTISAHCVCTRRCVAVLSLHGRKGRCYS